MVNTARLEYVPSASQVSGETVYTPMFFEHCRLWNLDKRLSAVWLRGEASWRRPQQQIQSSHRLASVGGTRDSGPDRVTGAEQTSDDTAAVCAGGSSGRPGVCSSCAPTANVATSIFRPRRRRR